ncbi:MAG: serine/threonine-protein kinase [Gemmataceae bacterium]
MNPITVPFDNTLRLGATTCTFGSSERLDWIGPYEPVGLLGRGGQALVLRVRAHGTGPDLALKILHMGELVSSSERRSLSRELEASRRLHHPAIVPILDAGETQGRSWIVMPLIQQGSLAHRLEKGAMAPRQAVELLLQVANGVGHAHQAGVLHRDLKPSNILLDEFGRPQVSDFGLARFSDSHSKHTYTGQMLGSYPYMAPEQASGYSHEATPATDVWALGVILYELLTGQRPFEGTTAEVLEQIRKLRYRPLRKRDPSLPVELETIVTKCLQRSPKRRYPDANALASDLQSWLQGTPLSVQSTLPIWGSLSARASLPSLLLCCLLPAWGLAWLASGSELAVPERRVQAMPVPHTQRTTLWVPRLGPRQMVFAFGGDLVTIQPRRDPGVVSTFSAALMELLPAHEQRGPFRLTLRARQSVGGELSDVGLYAGYQVDGPKGSRVHRFVQCSFKEPGHYKVLDQRWPVQTTLHPRMVIERPGLKPLPVGGGGVEVSIPSPAEFDRNRPPWRQLILEVYHDHLQMEIDGKRTRMSTAQAVSEMAFLGQLHKQTAGLPRATISPTQAAGLVVWGATLEIESIVYEPLAPEASAKR